MFSENDTMYPSLSKSTMTDLMNVSVNHDRQRHTVKTEMLLWPKVCCFSWKLYTRCYCEVVTNVVYNNFQDKLVPLGAMYSALGNKKFLKSISIHFNCSFVQLKQQTSGHNNISLLAVQAAHTRICLSGISGHVCFVWICNEIEGLCYKIGASLSESHISVTALQDAWVCPVSVAIYRKFKLNERIRMYISNLHTCY